LSTFVLKLFFSGLMAFVPNENGTEVTVLLLDVDHNYTSSDSTSLAHHTPLLFARGGSCSGDCPQRDSDIADFVYSDLSSSAALDALEEATSGGGAWALSGSDLSVEKGVSTDPALPSLTLTDNTRGTVNGNPAIIPTTAGEREDLSWLASMSHICSGCTIDPDLLGEDPPAIVAARFHIRNGRVFTYSVARIGSDVTPVHFQRLDGTGSTSSYTQAIATWVGAEIEVSGDSIEIAEDKFDSSTGRSMTLTPDEDGKVEVAVVNLPPFVPPSSPFTGTPDPGKHFEYYYELASTPPAQSSRLVPKPGAASGAPSYSSISWTSIHPQISLYSDLLNALRMNTGRTIYEQALCPPSTWP